MTRDLDPGHVRDLLDKLGDNPDTIATTLRLGGHVGRRDDGTCCPVANYLTAHQVPGLNVMQQDIEDASEADTWADPDRWMMCTPLPVQKFVAAFDAGGYNDLWDPEAGR
jgi:hypothetical protein